VITDCVFVLLETAGLLYCVLPVPIMLKLFEVHCIIYTVHRFIFALRTRFVSHVLVCF